MSSLMSKLKSFKILPGVFTLICFSVVMLFFAGAIQAVTIKSVERGSGTLGGGNKAVEVPITAVDVQKSMIIFGNTASGNPSIEGSLETAEFTASDVLYVSRNTAGDSTQFEWSVVEFLDGVAVQNGYSKISAKTEDKTVYLGASIDPNTSFLNFVIQSPAQSPGDAASWTMGEIVSTNQLKFSRAYHTNDVSVEITWQVISFEEDVTVQHGTTSMLTTDPDPLTKTQSITALSDVNKAFVVTSSRAASTGVGADFSDMKVAVELTDASTLTLKRKTSAVDADVAWFVVEFSDDTWVYKNTAAWATTTTNVAIVNQPDLTRAFGFCSFNTDSTALKAAITEYQVGEIDGASALGTDQFYFARGGSANSDLSYFVVELAPIEIRVPNGDEEWRVGETPDIEWKHATSVESGGTGYNSNHKIKIELSIDGGVDAYPYLIYESPATPAVDEYNCASDSYPWTIPASVGTTPSTDPIQGKNLKIKLTDTDASSGTNINYSTTDGLFEIIADISLTYPVGGETIPYDATPANGGKIEWTFSGDATGRTVAIKYDENSGATYPSTLVTGLAANSSPYNIDWVSAPLPLGDRLRIKIEQVGEEARVFTTSTSDFTVEPDLTYDNKPAGGEIWKIGEVKTIQWSALGGTFMTNGVDFQISRNAGGTYATFLHLTQAQASGSPDQTWTVDGPSSTEAILRIQSTDYPLQATDESPQFTIQQTITVTNPPVTGQIWRVGEGDAEGRTIDFTIEGTIANVDVHYSTVDSPVWTTDADWTGGNGGEIYAAQAAGTGSFSLTWPGGVANNIDDIVWLRVRDSANTDIYGQSNSFNIKGNITLSEPVPGQVFKYGVNETVSWTVTGNVNGTAEVFIDNGTGYTSIGTKAIAGAGPYNIAFTPNDAANHLGTDCDIKVEMQGDANTVGTVEGFKLRPNITITYPTTPGETVNVDDDASKMYIKWTPEPEDFGTVNICYDLNGGGDSYPAVNVVMSDGVPANNIASNNKPNAVDIGYEWKVPDDIGMVTNTMRVKVYKTGEYDDVSDVSANFTVLGTLTLTGASDGDGSTWNIGTNQVITWTAKGDITPVHIDYMIDGASWNDLTLPAGYAAGSGDRTCGDVWNPIPDDVLSSVAGSVYENDVKFRITSDDGTIEDISTGTITIQARIILSKPQGSSTVLTVVDPADNPVDYTENQIGWTYNGDGLSVVDIMYDTGGAGTFAGEIFIGATASAGGWNLWEVPDIIGDDILVRVKAQGTDGDYVYDDSNSAFKVKGQIKLESPAPDTQPDGTTVWTVHRVAADADFDSTQNIQWRCYGTLNSGAGVNVQYSPTGLEVNFANVANGVGVVSGSGALATVQWDVPDNIGSDNKIRIVDPDAVGTPADSETSAKFTIKGELKIVRPGGGETHYVSTGDTVIWKYAGTIGNVKITLDDAGGTGGYDTLEITPSIAYDNGENPPGDYECEIGWTCPATAGNDYSVKIEPLDPNNADAVTTSGTHFPILGTITLVEPGMGGGGEIWYVNDADSVNRRIDWTPSTGIVNVDIFLDTDSSDNGGVLTKERTIVLNHNEAVQKPYEWMIPDAPTKIAVTSDKCRIIIDDADDLTGLVTDESTDDFMIKPVITPGALIGTPWQLGESPTITWSMEGSITNMRLYYAADGTNFEVTPEVDNILAGDGQVDWYIDPSGYDKTTNGAVGKLKLVRINGASEDADVLLGPFEVDGLLTWNSPTVATDFNATASGYINWSVDGTVGLVALKYSTEDPTYSDASFTNLIEQDIAANWCDFNVQDYEFTVPVDVQPKIKIRVMDQVENEVYCESPAVCKIKGNVVFNQGTTEGQSLTVGQTDYYVSWTNVGTFSGLKASYKRVGIDTQWQEIDWALAGTATNCQWIPGDSDISDDVLFRVEDTADSTVAAETDPSDPNNTVVGSLELRKPILGDISDAYTVGQPGTIKWFKQGAIADLVFTLETSFGGGFFSAGTNLDDQDPGTSGFENEYTTWAVPDMITSEGRIKVTSGSLSDETIVTKEFDIKGAFNSIPTPNASTVWKVGDDHTVTWNAVGTMSAVDIYLITPSGGEQQIADDYSGSGLIYGVNSFTWTYTGDAKQDQMTDQAQIKIVSSQHADVSIPSAQFDFISKITVTDQPAKVTAETSPTVTWTYTGTKLGTVDIVYDPNGDGDVSVDGVVLENGVSRDAGAGGYTPTGTLPATLLTTGKMLVRDATETYAYGITASSFETEGYIEVTQPNGATTWKVGDSTNNILWNYKGDIGNVKVWADYNGNDAFDGGVDENLSDTMSVGAAGSGSLEWPGNIGDHVATGAKIWVESIDPIPSVVKDDSAPFNILGQLELDNDQYGIGGRIIKIDAANGQSLDIGWYTQGSAIDEVTIQYSVNGIAGPFTDIITRTNNNYGPYGGATNANVNTYQWNNDTPVVPIPTGQKETLGVIKVIAVISGVPQLGTNADSSGQGNFVICGDIVVNPNLDGEVWEADNATVHTITWEYSGPVSTVDVLYAKDGSNFALYPALQTNVDADTLPTGDDTGFYDWTIPSHVDQAEDGDLLSNGQNARIKVQDNALPINCFGLSQPFTVKSVLNFSAGTLTTLSNGVKAGTQDVNVVIERKGKTASFDLEYSRNEGGAYTSIVAGDTFVGTNLSKTILWDVPEYVGHQDVGTTGYMLQVTSPDGASTPTPLFNVYGELNCTEPGATWQMTDNVTIDWNVVHGDIANVNVIGLRKLGTWGVAADEFPIAMNTDADNEEGFLLGGYGTYVGRGSCNWTVAEEGAEPTIISDGVKIKVVDAEANYATYNVEHESAGTFVITGKITVTTPSSDWIVGNTTEQIHWYADGDMQNVKIEFNNGSSWDIVASTTTSDPGDNYFDVSNWEDDNQIPDVRYEACELRVSSIDDIATDVSDVTDSTFYTYPEISSVSVVNPPLIAETQPQVQWSYTTAKVSNVDILVDYNGDDDWSDAVSLQNNVAIDAGQPHTTVGSLNNSLPANAKIRVRDNNITFQDKIYKDTGYFEIIGEITITQPYTGMSPKWKAGDTDKDIVWTSKGDIGSVKIWADYDGDGDDSDPEDETLIGSRQVGNSPFTWLVIPQSISTGAKIWIESIDALNTPVSDDSEPFNILGGIALDTGTYLITGYPVKIKSDNSQSLTIGWYTQGSAIDGAKLWYSLNGTDGPWFEIIEVANTKWGAYPGNGVTDLPTVMTYTWDNNSAVPIPTATAETNAMIKVTAVISSVEQADTKDISGAFAICGDIKVNPNLNGEVWEADGATLHTITWEYAGPISNVNVLYAADGSDYVSYPALASNVAADTLPTGDGSGFFNWTIPSHVDQAEDGDLLSNGEFATIKVEDADGMDVFSYGESQTFTVKSKLDFSAATLATLAGGLKAGTQNVDIVIERNGYAASFDLDYSKNEGGAYTPVVAGETFVGTAVSKTVQWDVPEYRGHEDDGTTGYMLEVFSPDGASTETPIFNVYGELNVTTIGTTWQMTDPVTITWDVVHGNIVNVDVIGLREGGTWGNAADEFPIATNTLADNVNGFNEAGYGSYVARGSCNWTVAEEGAVEPTIISDGVKIKVVDANTYYSAYNVEHEATGTFIIKGKITVTTPGSDWIAETNTEQIHWYADGDMQNVKIEFNNGSGWDIVATTTTTDPGDNYFDVSNWEDENQIPDVKYDACELRVSSIDDIATDVSDVTDSTFYTYPEISSVIVITSPVMADSPVEVQWDYTTATVSNVDILIDLDGDDDWSDAETLVVQPSVAVADGKAPATYTTINSLPATLSPNAKIRVRDSQLALQDYVAGDSTGFEITGTLTVNPPNASSQWVIGTGSLNVNWAYTGDVGDLRIWLDYDGDGVEDAEDEQLDINRAVTNKPLIWLGPVDDYVSTGAKVWIEAANLTNPVDSAPFNISGAFTNLTVTTSDTEVIADKAGATTITWTRTGVGITEALLEYSFDGSNWNTLDDAPLGSVDLVNNTGVYSWTPLATDIDETCWVRISDPNNSSATDQFGPFTMTSMIEIYKPDSNNVGPNGWEAGTTKRISWSKYGDFANVKIYYSDDGVDWSHEIDPAVSKPSNVDLGDVDGGGAGTEDGYFDYDWIIDDTVTLSPTAQIKVVDEQHPTYCIVGVSDQFTTKGNVQVLLPDGTGEGATSDYVAGQSITLRWKRWGNITGVNVYYDSTASGEVPIPSLQGIDFVGALTEHQVTWTPPEIVGTDYVIRVKDKGNEAETQDDSVPFELEGKLAITDPNGQGETMYIRKPADSLKTITWEVVHGNIQNVKIVGTRTGTFPDPAGDFVVVDSTDADNVLTFSASNFGIEGCVARGSYNWDIQEPVAADSIISDTVRLKILDENTDYSVESLPSSALFKIKGQIVVTTPAVDWNVDDIDKNIEWVAYGDIQNVLIKFDNGTTPVDVVNPATGIASGEGAKIFPVTSWTYNNDGNVPDERSLNCQLEVIDFNDQTNVSGTSGTFGVYPVISNAATSVTPLMADTKPIVSWSYTGTTITSVDILVDLNGDDDYSDADVLQNDVPFNSSPHETANKLPVTLSDNAKILVRDNNSTYSDYVKDDTAAFVITGEIVVTQPNASLNPKWKVGDVDKDIIWTYKGDIGDVNIEADYDGDATYDQTLATVAVNTSPWTWPTIPSQVSNNAMIKIESVDKPGVILDESEPFNIIGEVDFTNVTGQLIKVKRDDTQFMDIEWTTKGNGITKVKFEYTPTGLAQDYIEISSDIDNTFTDGSTLNSWTWDAFDAIPVPTDVASVLVKLRISASTPLQPETTNESGSFVICGNVYVETPSGGEKWVADGVTANTIEWEIAGKVDNVKILYAQDGSTFDTGNPITSSTDADNVTAGQYGSFPWTIPSNVTSDLISNAQAKIKIQDADAVFETNVVHTSQPFTVKGVLAFEQTTLDALAAGLTAGDNQTLSWSRKGKIGGVDVSYSRNNASTFPNPIQSVAFDIGVATKSVSWDVPEYVGTQAGTNGYAIRIEDTSNSETEAETPVFTVNGELLGTNANDTWFIGTSGNTITWNVVHANIANVDIIGSRNGSWGGAEEFTIASNQDADNVTTFADTNFGTLGYAAQGSYPWNIVEKTPTIISEAVKIKILDADTNYSVESIVPGTFTIKGQFEVTAPSLGDTIIIEDTTPFDITWNRWGDIATVKIEYSTDSVAGVGGTWTDVIASTANDGTYEWTAPNTVPISTNLYIKVTDNTVAGGVYDVSSDAVTTKGWFEFVQANGDTPDTNSRWDVAPSSPHEIKWTKHGNELLVKIEYSPDGSNYYDVIPSTANTGTFDWSPVHDTTNLSAGKTATIKISKVGEAGNFAVSPVFKLIGKIALINPTGGEAYSFGDSESVSWVGTGLIQNVSIKFSADELAGDDPTTYEQTIIDSTPAGNSGEQMFYPWPINGPTSNSVVLRVADVLDSTVNAKSDYQNPIKIMVVYTIDTPANGNVWAVGSPQTITWRTLLGTSPQVKLEYWDGADWQAFDGSTGVTSNDGTEPWQVRDDILDGSQMRISDPRDYPGSIQVMDTTNDTPVVTEEYFKIRGDLRIKEPNTAVDWNVGSSHDIVFTTTGSIDFVKLEYSIVGGGIGNYPASPALPFNPIATGVATNPGGDTTEPWTIPDALTTKARVRVVDESDPTVLDECDVDFTIRDVLTFDGGTFTAGEDMFVYDSVLSPVKKTINWSRVGSISTIKLEYSVDGGGYQTITGGGSLDASLGTFDWEIDDGINTTADSVLVRISTADAVNEPALEAVSPGMNIKGVLKLNEPPAILYVDDPYTITWQKSGSISHVELQYSVGGAGFSTLPATGADDVDITGAGPDYTFPWSVRNSINGNIVLRVEDLDDGSVSDETNPFRIAGALKLLTPNGGSYYEVDQGCGVTWEVHGTIAQVKLSYDTAGSGTYANPITTLASAPTSWSWPVDVTTASDIGKQVRMKIEDNDGAAFTRSDTSDANFEIRGKLTVTSPVNGNIWLSTSTADPITWTKNGALATVKIELDIDDGSGYQPLADAGADSVNISGAGPVYSFNWTVPSIQSTQCKIRVTDLADATGNTYDESEGFFTIRAGFKWISPEESPVSGVNPMVATDVYALNWQTFGDVATVKIFYSTNLGNSWKDFLNDGAPITDPDTEGDSIINTSEPIALLVPDDIASTVYLMILDANNSAAQAELQNCRIEGELTIVKPDASSIWLAGGSGRVEWTMKGTLNLIKIDYSKNSGGSFVFPNGGAIYNSVSAVPLFADWLVIPEDAISPNTVVRITDTTNPDVTDQYGDFPIKASFALITPKDTDTWIVDDPEDITWTTVGTVANVKLYYYKESITNWVLINESADFPNNSAGVTTYPWAVADNVSDDVKIRIVDALDPTATGDSLQFKIRGSLNITQPNDGYLVDDTEIFVVGRPHNILWEPHGSVGDVTIEYFKDPIWVEIYTGTNSGGFPWDVEDTLTDNARIRITSEDWPDITDTSDADFKIVGGFTVTYPQGGEALLAADDTVIITWTSTSAYTPNVRIDYSLDSGGTYDHNITLSTGNDGNYEDWTVPADSISGTVRMRVADASDTDGYDESDNDFRIRAVLVMDVPNGDEQFIVGRSQDIEWTSVGTITDVRLEFSRTANFITDKVLIGDVLNSGTYPWTILDDFNIDDGVLMRVSDPDDPEARDDSDATFRITAGFTVISPNGTESWAVGSNHEIQWSCTSVEVTDVKIEYSTNGGATYPNSITSTANDGSYWWNNVDDNISDEVRINVSDDTGLGDPTAFDESDANFDIHADLELLTPNGGGGQELTVGEDYDVTWTTLVADIANVKLEYSKDDFVTPIEIIASTPDDGTHPWKIPNDVSATVKVRVSDQAAPYGFDISDNTFTIVRGTLSLTAPVGGETWVTREEHNISWTTTTGSIPLVNIDYSKNDFGSDVNVVVADYANVVSPNSYPWSIPDDRSTTVKVRVSDVRDVTVNDISPADFTIDYYSISWVLRDLVTNEQMSQISVVSTSDKGDEWNTDSMPNNPSAPLGSPVTVELPYGFWTCVWSKTGFGDKQYSFTADADQTLETIYLETTAIHIWRAASEYTYNVELDELVITSWLERDGSVVTGAIDVTIDIYDDTGALFETLSTTTGNAAGFFTQTLPAPTGLEANIVYGTVTIINNASGATFRTPGSFSITEVKQLASTEAAIQELTNNTIPLFQSGIETAISDGVAEQKRVIEEKMNQQIEVIETQTTLMKNSVDATLSSFEERTATAIEQLQIGADQATEAGEALETIAMRQSGELILPTSVLTGATAEVRYRIDSGLMPLMDIIAFDGTVIMGARLLIESATTAGLYGFDIFVDANLFVAGKAFTVLVTESTTGNLQAGSVMVESTTLSSIEGLASSIPQIKSITDDVLSAIKGVEGTLATGGDVGLALESLQESIDDLPNLISTGGGGEEAINQVRGTINDIADKLIALAGEEGFDISEIIEDALSSSPTIQDIKKKTEKIKSAIKFMQALFEHKFGGMEDEPIVSTSLSTGSVIVSIVAANPSKTKPQMTKIKVYLPKEITPKYIIDTGGLDVEFDADKSIYYVYQKNIELAPKEVRVYKVEMEDVWMIPRTTIDLLKLRAAKLQTTLEGTEHQEKIEQMVEGAYKRLDEVVKLQNDTLVSREQHIGIYRTNLQAIEQIKEDLVDMEKLMIRKPGEVGALTPAMTWKVILIVIVFIGLLTAVFFFTWYRKASLTGDAIAKAKQFTFPEDKDSTSGEENKK